ncbi:MAG: hypothetical protein HY769_06850 [Candidatus Stahlbacteria bacterium]|nr:hypothetical protein [Candidatus Stahlbacteria bacterium]
MKRIAAAIIGIILLTCTSYGETSFKIEGKVFSLLGTRTDTRKPDIDTLKYDVTDMVTEVSPLSRICFTGLVDGKNRAYVELRPTSYVFEQIYGIADLSKGQILAGKIESIFNLVWGRTFSPLSPVLIGYGKAWAGRIPMFMYSLPVAKGSLKLALCSPSVWDVSTIKQHAAMPQVQVALGQKMGPLGLEVSGIYNSTAANEDEVGEDYKDVSATAYGAALITKIAFAPVAFTLDGYYGQNIGFARAIGGLGAKYAIPTEDSTLKVCNATGYGGFVDGEVTLAKSYIIKGGFGTDMGFYADIDSSVVVKMTRFASLGYKVSPEMTLGMEYNAIGEGFEETVTKIISSISLICDYKFF